MSSLNHFSVLRFSESYWRLSSDERSRLHGELLSGLRDAAEAVYCYQLFPTEAPSDFLLWTAASVEDKQVPAVFFEGLARALAPMRQYVEPKTVLWGLTRPSQYSKSRSRQEIDPFADARSPYLIIYPFTKTADWYSMKQEARQGMMNEHIRIGKQYESINQLLLYSFGLQDQEFVVVYETDDLAVFSALVHELRTTEARRFTLNDTPVHTAVYRGEENPLSLWC